MECINHPGTVAAGTCQICGKALCAPCMNRFNPPLCEPCLLTHNAGVARRLWFELGMTAVLFFGVFLAFTIKSPAQYQAGIVFGLILACAYWGWQFMRGYSAPVVFTNGAGLLTYFVIKLFIVICFGFIIAPWQIYRRIREIRAIGILKKQVSRGNA